MTGSWAMDEFIIGSIILVLLPGSVWFYKEVIKKKRGEVE